MIAIVTFLTGLLFGVGLALSEMTNPMVVLGFLDLFGTWNPSLLWVMGAAISVAMLGYYLKRRLPQPLLAQTWQVPSASAVDQRLVLGAILFGVGWGLSGYCPGPGLTALINHPSEGIYFVGALLAGSALFQWQTHRKIV